MLLRPWPIFERERAKRQVTEYEHDMARPGSNNGNVTSEQIASSSGLNADQSFMADAYNRLQTAQETVCGAQRGHDELYLYDEEVRRVEKTTGAAATV